MKWVKIQSWHAVKIWARGGEIKAYCGKWADADAEIVDDLPSEKSCESCLRIIGRIADEWTGQPDMTWKE